jgi:hypothetical protein
MTSHDRPTAATAVVSARRSLLPAATGPGLLGFFAVMAGTLAGATGPMLFVDAASEAGLRLRNVSGSETKDYIIETTGQGAAMFDYDNDGDLDVILVNGSTLERMDEGGDLMVAFYRNGGDGKFTDLTAEAGFHRRGWGNGVCVADYDNDGFEDVYVTAFGPNVLWRNTGTGRFEDMTSQPVDHEWSTGCAFGDYDRDGNLDLYVANFVDFDTRKVPARGRSPNCVFLGLDVLCGPKGLDGQADVLYRNTGKGSFREVTRSAGIIDPEYYGFGVIFTDIDNDGWPDIYVANDSVPNLLFRNNRDGTFTEDGLLAGVALSANGQAQAGMGVDAADYDRDGDFDLIVTNFSHDYNTLYRNNGNGEFIDVSVETKLASTAGPYVGWGVHFADLDNDGLTDVFIANGHVYPDVDRTGADLTFGQRNQIFRNVGNGTFAHVSRAAGDALRLEKSSRGSAVGDIDNDGDLDLLVINLGNPPTLLRNESATRHNWIVLRLFGTKSNRSAIGARVQVTSGGHRQTAEVRSGGSFLSQSDRRLHFGLGTATRADVEIRWPSGLVETLPGLQPNRVHTITEGDTAVGLPARAIGNQP